MKEKNKPKKPKQIEASNAQDEKPFIPAHVHLPEITIKGVILGVFLAVVLAGSNAYLGLKMGQTVSASIPAAVISMTVLRLFRRSNILENNIVQTIASAGAVVASGAIFTMPALIFMGYWQRFDYFQITLVSVLGSILGILCSTPLRRTMIVESRLRFPEGVAAAEVLKAGEQAAQGAKDGASGTKNATGAIFLVIGTIASGIIKFCQTGLQIFGETISYWFRIGPAVTGFDCGFSLSIVAAGYIAGMSVCVNFIIGMFLAWCVGVPLYAIFSQGPIDFGLPMDASAMDFAMAIRGSKMRYIGVGTMLVGGFWVFLSLVKPMKVAVTSALSAFFAKRKESILRTEKDIPIMYALAGSFLMGIPLLYLFDLNLSPEILGVSASWYWTCLMILTALTLLIGFVCSAIGAYMAGIVGASSTPTSGITISAILIIAISCVFLLSGSVVFGAASAATLSLCASTIMVAGIVAVAASVGCDNLQDLKTGQLVGATPWKQQWTLLIGSVASALVISYILELLYQAYGIGGSFPREGMDPKYALAAPQATLMASVTQGIFERTLDWSIVGIGVFIGLAVLAVDQLILAKRKSSVRLSILAIALGIYLPPDTVLPLIIGGALSSLATRRLKKATPLKDQKALLEKTERQGVMFSAGMIAGDALMGIFLAIPFAAYQRTDVLAIVGPSFHSVGLVLGTGVFVAICFYLYRLARFDVTSK